jgi:plasmid stabilization system protein ParE
MKIVWTEFAEYQLSEIYTFLYHKADEATASRIVLGIVNASERLVNFPEMGTKEKEEYVGDLNYRYLVQGHFKIVYEVLEREVVVQDVFDTRLDPSKMLKGR